LATFLKPQNGIFIDLGNNVPAYFLVKITAGGLLQICKKVIDFLKQASALLFGCCCVALLYILFIAEHELCLITANSMSQHFLEVLQKPFLSNKKGKDS
jgi:hypothetical protein